MGIVRTVNVGGTTMDITGTVISGIGIGIGMATETGAETETGTAETTDVGPLVTMVGAQEIWMTTDVLTMKIDAVIIDVTMTMVTVEVVVKTVVRLNGVAGEEGEEMDLVLPKGDPQHPKVLFRYLNGSGKRRGGMSMPLDTSNIQPCKQSKQVGFVSTGGRSNFSQSRRAGLFNLPGANRTQVPPILGIAGLPPPIPVQTFGMGIGSNPNLSRQSRRLYIGSITSDVNEQNLAEFFNSKMIEMSIGTGGPGNPVLAVQCNYEKNYAFVEVRSISSSF